MRDFSLQELNKSKLIDGLRTDPRIRAELARLSQLRPLISSCAIVLDWTIIGLCVWAGETYPSWYVWMTGWFIIASRQHALLVLMHEGAHYRLGKRPWLNDLISDYLAAFPLFADTDGYRRHHWSHHRHLNTQQDPDWVRKTALPEWNFPKSKAELSWDLILNIYRAGKEWVQLAWHFSVRQVMTREGFGTSVHLRKLFYFAALVGLTHFLGLWREVGLYWLTPLFLIFPSLQRIRSMAEHFALDYASELSQTRNVCGPSYETFFFGPHHVNLHLTHHMFPAVPFYNLPRLTAVLTENGVFSSSAHVNSSYILPSERSVFSDFMKTAASQTGSKRAA